MIRQVALTVFVGLLLAVGVNADDSKKEDGAGDTKDEAKKLVGSWKLTRKEVRGDLWSAAEIRKIGIFIEEDKIAWTDDGKESFRLKGALTIDSSVSPATIDVEFTRGDDIGKKMLGIYEIKGDKLTICWNYPGEEKRPTKFVTKTAVGAGSMLETYRLADDEKKGSDPKKDEGKSDAKVEIKKLDGNWKLIRKEVKGRLWPTDFFKEGMFIEDDKLIWTEDGKEGGATGTVTFDTATNPPSIDVEITRGSLIGKKMLGIYEVKGDKLTICWSEPGGEKRPTKFVSKAAVGAGAILENYKAVDVVAVSGEKKDTEPKKSGGKEEVKAESKKFDGKWKLTRKEVNGNFLPSGIRKEGIMVEDGKIAWTEDGKPVVRNGAVTMNAGVSPATIDVDITRGRDAGKKLLGIYEIKGDKLTICWSEPGGEKRPTKFITKVAVGAGEIMETYQSLDGENSTADKKGTDAKTDEEKAEAKKLEGNWKMTRSEYKGNLGAPDFRKEGIFFEDGKVVWTEDGKAHGRKGTVSFSPATATNPASIDVEITRGSDIGKKVLGIYEIKGDKLTICWGESGGEKRPTKFVTKPAVGAGVTLETYQKQKDQEK